MVVTREIRLSTKGHTDIIDITEEVEQAVARSGVKDGIVCLFVPGSTGIVTTMEFEPGLVEDLKRFWEKIASSRDEYQHNIRWGDGNGYAHVRAAASGPSLTLPFKDGKIMRGTWQDIVFVDFDNRPRSRTLIVQVVGE